MPATITYSFPATYAGLALEVVSFSSDHSRDVAVYRATRGHGGQVSDRGLRERTDNLTCTITGGADEVRDGRARLLALKNSGESRLFQHPLDGEWMARLSEMSESTSHGDVTFQVTLIEDTELPNRRSELSEVATLESVEALAAIFDTSLALVLESNPSLDIPDSPLNTVQSWSSEQSTTDQVQDVEAIRKDMQASRSSLDAVDSYAAYQAILASIDLLAEIERYSRALQSKDIQWTSATVRAEQTLAAFLRVYPAEESLRIYNTVIAANAIANPLRLKAGTVLRLPRRNRDG